MIWFYLQWNFNQCSHKKSQYISELIFPHPKLAVGSLKASIYSAAAQLHLPGKKWWRCSWIASFSLLGGCDELNYPQSIQIKKIDCKGLVSLNNSWSKICWHLTLG